jgi:hypothetical protein
MRKRIHFLVLLFICVIAGTPILEAQQIDNFKERGVIYISTFGFVNGFNEIKYSNERSTLSNNTTAVSVHQMVGYQFNPYFSLGMGVGFEKWKYTSFIPLYADLRVNLLSGQFSPFLSVNFGYSSKWYESPIPDNQHQVIDGATEGIYFSGGLGLKVMFSESAAGIISFEYKMQESSIKWSDNLNLYPTLTTNQESRVIYQFLGVRAGILF